jgi:hypothetical protein
MKKANMNSQNTVLKMSFNFYFKIPKIKQILVNLQLTTLAILWILFYDYNEWNIYRFKNDDIDNSLNEDYVEWVTKYLGEVQPMLIK